MRITNWAEYAVHFALLIARHERTESTTLGASEIAAKQGLALNYTHQILKRLRDGGVIDSVRGPQGGYRLKRLAKEITLRDIFIAAEGETLEVICESKPISTERCGVGSKCGLRPVWEELSKHVDSYLERVTLEDLLNRFEEHSELSSDSELVNIATG